MPSASSASKAGVASAARTVDAAGEESARRSVVPEAAGRSLWLAAVWTGVGAAAVCATLAIVAVAICWLPVSGASGHSMSAVRAGLLTFLAGLHGGITIDGTSAQFLPLGLTIIVGLTAWRAGAGLADAAAALDERDSARLVVAGLVQAVSFTVTALLMVPFAHLGTSSAPLPAVAAAGLMLFGCTGAVAYVRASPLRMGVSDRVPAFMAAAARAAAAALGIYFAFGAALVAGSIVAHAGRVEALSRQVGGGWGGVPILLLGLLATPNAVIAASAYLVGPGFAVGSGSFVNAFSTTHGLVPAFPILGALPNGHGADAMAWMAIAATPLAAGGVAARLVLRGASWRARFRDAAAAALLVAAAMLVLGWQAGGGIGGGRLRVVGPSPWRLGALAGAEVAVVAMATLAVAGCWSWWQHRREGTQGSGGTVLGWLARAEAEPKPALAAVTGTTAGHDDDESGKLAG